MRSALVAAAIGASLLRCPRCAGARAVTSGATTGRLLVTLKPRPRRARRGRPRRRAPARGAGAPDVTRPAAAPRRRPARAPATRSAALAAPPARRPARRRRRARAPLHACATSPTTRASPPPSAARTAPSPSGGPRARTSRPRGTSPAATARASRSSTPASTARTPSSTNKIVATADFDDNLGAARRPSTRTATARTSRRWPARQPDNGIGIAGAGLGCDLLVAKSDLTESSVAKAIVWAADNGAEAINMSFGTDGRFAAAPRDRLGARTTPTPRAWSSSPRPPTTRSSSRATRPTSCSRPTRGSDINRNLGLSVTAANAADARASFAGRGTQISMAAYGTYGPGGANGLLGGVPVADHQPGARRPGAQDRAVPLPHRVGRRHALRLPAGNVDERAAGRGRRGADAPPQPGPPAGRHRPDPQADRQAPRGRRVDAGAGLGHPRRRLGAGGRALGRRPRADLAAAAPEGHRPLDPAALARGGRRGRGRRGLRRRALRALALDAGPQGAQDRDDARAHQARCAASAARCTASSRSPSTTPATASCRRPRPTRASASPGASR